MTSLDLFIVPYYTILLRDAVKCFGTLCHGFVEKVIWERADNWGVSRQLGAKLDHFLIIQYMLCFMREGLWGHTGPRLLSFNLNTHISTMLASRQCDG